MICIWRASTEEERERVRHVLEQVEVEHELRANGELLVAPAAAEVVHRLLLSALTEGEIEIEEESGGGLILPPGH